MKCELLAPAGSIEAFRAALIEGADAVYIGGRRFGARAYADNPDDDELLRAIDQAHILDRRLYLTVNTLLKDRELEGELYDWLLPFYRQGLDGVIVQDPGAADFLHREFPELPLHASTQMTVTGAHGADFLQKNGFCRVVPARELSVGEIREIYERTGMEIECFVHGAMCFCYSGQCLMSSLSGGRSGNRGRCAGICRLPFRVREGERLLTGRHTQYPLNMKDMCAVELLPELLSAGVCSLKIEGRMKKPAYTAGVVRVYRKYLDLCLDQADTIKERFPDGRLHVSREDMQFLWDLFNRDGFSTGYYHMHSGREMIALRNEKLEGIRAKAAQKVTEEIQSYLSSPEAGRAIQAEADGILTLRPGQQASLTLIPVHRPVSGRKAGRQDDRSPGLKEGKVQDAERRITAFGEEPAPSRNRPVTAEEVRRQIMKTGGSSYRFRRLTIDMDPGLFVPVGQLNRLRREAFRLLEEAETGAYRRNASGAVRDARKQHVPEDDDAAETQSADSCSAEYWAEIETEDQFRCLLSSKRLAGFYLPVHLMHLAGKAREKGFRTRLALPWICRRRQEKTVREAVRAWTAAGSPPGEILVRNLEEAALLHEMGLQSLAVPDAGLYTMNTRAVRFFRQNGFTQFTVPHELNAKELRERDNNCSEMIVYGRVPVMLTAQCLKKTLDRCTRRQPSLSLEDRRGMRFPVLCDCSLCMNRILNAVPLNLLGEEDRKEIAALGVRSLRLLFTVESGEEALSIADTLQVQGPSTRGHFRRGVE